MKQHLLGGLISLLSFAVGLAVGPSSPDKKAPANQDNVPTSQATSTTVCPESDEFPGLIDDNRITKLNGVRLDLEYEGGLASVDLPWSIDRAKNIPLRNGHLLVSLGDTLYRLDGERHIVWSYYTAQVFIDYAYVDSTNLIYATAGDNIMLILNATTGEVVFVNSRNGRAAYGAAVKYGDDMCLVTDNFVELRKKARNDDKPMKDGITCWRGTKIVWHLDFPPDAKLVVNGKKILAVTKSKNAIYLQEITPPKTK